MNRDQILKLSSMPAASPSYPLPPFRFVDREYMIVIYESDPDAIRAALPEPLVPDKSNQVFYEWIRMPDSSGFGDYTESGVVIPCSFEGTPASFVSQMYLDDDPPIAAGREIWGFPKKYASPKLELVKDTLTGTLDYAGQRVAMGSMVYKHENQSRHPAKTKAALGKLQVMLKLIPDVDGTPKIAQLVGLNITEIAVKGSWSGPARLHLVPHVNAPVADLPVRRVVGGRHFLADLTLPGGRVLVDYMKS
ncbi:MAG: acetoacetate decarboxylase [Proteobacteria bacterium]|nr:acetoacetate decarboxylase [Pseudomonadota bacterium]